MNEIETFNQEAMEHLRHLRAEVSSVPPVITTGVLAVADSLVILDRTEELVSWVQSLVQGRQRPTNAAH